jgi:hypothetical protein
MRPLLRSVPSSPSHRFDLGLSLFVNSEFVLPKLCFGWVRRLRGVAQQMQSPQDRGIETSVWFSFLSEGVQSTTSAPRLLSL